MTTNATNATTNATTNAADTPAEAPADIAFLFPGQGSQRPGMGRDLVERHPELLDLYYRPADELLDLPLSKLCWEGSAEELQRTEVTQPAVFLTSLAILHVLRGNGIEPSAAAGHSLGEYTALVCAGVLNWRDALRLVRRRGELMARVNEQTPGTMAALIGPTAQEAEALCAAVRAQTGAVVEVANYNDPGQHVISGQEDAVRRVAAAARAQGVQGSDAWKAVPLKVGAPFHCSLMAGVEAEFTMELESVEFRDPLMPVHANVTGRQLAGAAEAKDWLRRQLAGSVRWTDTLRRMAEAGTETFVEVGPGRVLSGFCRTTLPQVPHYSTGDVRRLDRACAALAGN